MALISQYFCQSECGYVCYWSAERSVRKLPTAPRPRLPERALFTSPGRVPLTGLHSHKDTSNDHHTCSEQSFADLAFTEEEPCPQDGQDGTQLEECRYISNETKSDSCETKEWVKLQDFSVGILLDLKDFSVDCS